MHLKNVEIFCEVANNRSFSKAAKAIHVSQSSASQAVQSLEERLGVKLINRSTRPLELTAAGQVFLSGCRDILDRFRQIEESLKTIQDDVTGRIRISAIYSVGLLSMERFVKKFHEQYPGIEIQLSYSHPDDVYDHVLQDQVDFGLLSFPRDGGEISCLPWQNQEIVLVVPADHPLANQNELTPSEINGEPFIALSADLKIRRKINRWLKDAGVQVDITHTFDDIENVKRAIEAGAGISLLPHPTVVREEVLGTLKAIRLMGVQWVRPLGIVHRRHKQLSIAAQRFVEMLQNDFVDDVSMVNDHYRAHGRQEAVNSNS
ncbi:MAG: LysR family transcriptional regulator [Planctomycetaceae bacterium]|nr:LysR family transcriptional regulator [Planctomycetaceae bacterium]